MNAEFLALLELLKGGHRALGGGTRQRHATGQRDRASVHGPTFRYRITDPPAPMPSAATRRRVARLKLQKAMFARAEDAA
jgi:hypothetical protein